jgi:hypothetical protein
MYSLKKNGDNIAQEFAGLLKGAAPRTPAKEAVVKTASLEEAPAEAENVVSDSELEDLILDSEEEREHYASDLIDVSGLDSYASEGLVLTARAKHIIDGLKKISKDLSNKGESFAADVVEATAKSIIGDFKKEAAKKTEITDSLSKMAKELSDSGDQFAADMVLSTMSKIA